MPWLIAYLVTAALPPLAVVAYDGWRSGVSGDRPSTEPNDLRVAVLLGLAWPLLLAALIMLGAAWFAGWLARRRSDRLPPAMELDQEDLIGVRSPEPWPRPPRPRPTKVPGRPPEGLSDA